MKLSQAALLVLLLGILGSMVSAAPGAQILAPLPIQDGAITLNGPEGTIEIFRDEWGVPHIYATNSHDLFFAQGYTQAQDRWWQMEWWRHLGNGRLSELAGGRLQGADIMIRTLGGHRVVEREFNQTYDSEVRRYLQAFADGVNAYILGREPGDLALEYTGLQVAGIKITVEPWTPLDTLIWGKFMAYNQAGNMDIELLLSELSAILSPEMIDQYGPPFPYGQKPTILQPEDLPVGDASLTTNLQADRVGIRGINTLLAGGLRPDYDFGFTRGLETGSNNWVATGHMTASGLPLIANDPHLGIMMPSIWYEVGLHCRPRSEECPFDVVGFTFSPSPGIIIGHNDRIAWAMTNVIPDTQDLYQIHINPDNPLQYEWNGQWRDMTVRQETIRSGDGTPPMTLQVRETHLGPIINDNQIVDGKLRGFNNVDPLALRWTALESGTIFQAVLEIDRARNWEEFRDALRYWDAPAQNFVFADIDGNIGYQTPGRMPIRAQGHTGVLPVPGWTDEYEWRGYIPFDRLPRILNPTRDYIVTANQAVAPLEYYERLADKLGQGQNYALSYYTAYGYRAQRINKLLRDLAPHTVATFERIQGDNYNGSSEEVLPFLAAVPFENDRLREARDWLLEWDYQMHMDSPQAALYAEFWASLVSHLYNDEFGSVHRATGNDNELWATYLLLQDPENRWWDDVTTQDTRETRDDILILAFSEAYNKSIAALGEDREQWRWGRLHTATFVSDPLGESGIALVESLVNRGPVSVSGGGEIINATSWNASSGDFRVQSLPSMRMIVDLSDFTKSVTIHTTGQSGNPASPHYDDMIDAWRMIEYHPMLWTRDQVEAAAAQKLIVTPGN